MKIMGLDIGGANTDCSIVEIKEDQVVSMENHRAYFPMWKDNDELEKTLQSFCEDDENIEVVCVSMTAELADGYESKKEGVKDISKKVMNVFSDKKVFFVTFDGLKSYDELQEDLLSAAAANWKGTSELIKYIGKDCIFMDMGSTTTDIIPINKYGECALGHSDLERLSSGELVYTGMLRTNLATIVHEVPVNNRKTRVSSELFSISADIHMILKNITEEDYTCSTPDNNKKDITSCKRRLARIVCADLDSLKNSEIIKLAEYIQEKQIEEIKEGLEQVVNRSKINTVVVVSLGRANLCERASESLNLNVVSLDNYMSKKATNVITALGAIQMYLDTLEKNVSLLKV